MPRYRAFISYSHSDARFAARLHRALESFRVPEGVGTGSGLKRNRIGSIFRDKSDLGAAPALPDALKAALRDSESLIVVCSPDAKSSKWVEHELVEFLDIHGDSARILAVVAADAGSAAAEALLPAALSRFEPLAADARKYADGFRLASLKIVAGLLNVRLDDLVRRDAKRRQTKLLATTVGSGVLALSMGVLALLALSAREDAQRRLTQSEELISFMLGDLRDQLAPLGQVKILESVGAEALEYFDSLEDSDLTDEALLRKSRALYQIGDVYFELGQFDAARSSFQSSLDQARILAAAQPADDERLYELAQAEFWVGYAAWEAGDLDAAENYFLAYSAAAKDLTARDRDNPDWAMEAFYASNNLGTLAMRRSRFEAAETFFDDALDRIGDLIEADPTAERMFEHATVLSWLGSAHLRRGDLSGARDSWLRALDMPWDETNADHQEERAFQLGFLSDAQLWLGDLDLARAAAAEAAAIAANLSRADSDSMRLRFAAARAAARVARIDYYSGNEPDYSSVEAAAKSLIDTDEPPWAWRLLALSVADLGLRAQHATAAAWGRALLDSPDFIDTGGGGIAPEYLDLAVESARRDPRETEFLRQVLTRAMEQYDATGDFLLACPLLRGFSLIGDQRARARMIDILSAAGARHPDFLASLD